MPAYGSKPTGNSVLNSCGFGGAEVTGHKLLPVIIGRDSCMCLMKTKVWKKHLALFVPCHLAQQRPMAEVGNQDTTEFEGFGERPVSKTFHPWSLALGAQPWGQPGEFGWSSKRQSEVPERDCFIGVTNNKPDNKVVEPRETAQSRTTVPKKPGACNKLSKTEKRWPRGPGDAKWERCLLHTCELSGAHL